MRKSKTYLFISSVLLVMMTAYAGHSQTSDTSKVWIPRQDALKVLAKAREADLLQQKLTEKQRDIDTLSERIRVKESQVMKYKESLQADSAIIRTYENELAELKDIRSILETESKGLRRQVRREKRKRFWTAMSGIVTTGAAFWLGTKL